MANQDTVVALTGPGTGRFQINALTLASVTETAFLMGTDTGTTVALLTIPVGGSLVGSGSPVEFNQNPAISSQSFGRKVSVGTEMPYFSSKTFDSGRPFKIRVIGTATINTGTSNTVAINLYQGTSATLGSDSKVAALTAGGATNTSVNFMLETVIQWDSTSQTLGGWYTGQCGNTLTAAHALTSAVSVTSTAGLTFIISGVFASTGGGTINISEFSCEQV